MIAKLSGYKTHIFAGLFVLVTGLEAAGVLKGFDPAIVKLAESALAAGGLSALRAGVQKAENANSSS